MTAASVHAEAEFDYSGCPNLEPLPFAQTDAATYDPSLVDWRSVVKSFEYLAAQEPRWVSPWAALSM